MHKFHIVVVDHALRFVRAVDLYGIDAHDAAQHLVLNGDEHIWSTDRI